jgi:predicted ATPase
VSRRPARFLADLARHSNVHRLALSGLTETEVVALVRADRGGGAGTDSERLARALYELTDGSPLFVKELLRVAPKSDLLRPPLPLSPTLRDVVSARFSQLPATDDLVIDAATVMGNVFEARLLADVMDTGIDPVLDALERAELLSLVEGVPGSPGRFAFTHALPKADAVSTRTGARAGSCRTTRPLAHPTTPT